MDNGTLFVDVVDTRSKTRNCFFFKCNDENDDKGFVVLVLMLLFGYCCKGMCANAWIFLFIYFARGKWSNHDSKTVLKSGL